MIRTAAALVVGNEILTGKVRDQNVEVLARELFGLGVSLRRVVLCPDEVGVIAEELNLLRRQYDAVFTSGGVGPTHDDVTMEAVALAFDRPLERCAELANLLLDYYGERLTESHLRMADLPAGYRLESTADARWPAVAVDNVYVLPGLPEVFRLKMPIIRQRLQGGKAFISRAVFTLCDEGEIAALLSRVVADFPEVAIGSYPVWNNPAYTVKVTFDGQDAGAVESALGAFVQSLPKKKITPPPAS
jgi:molybdenum cofactor synthesis domain-containing protein